MVARFEACDVRLTHAKSPRKLRLGQVVLDAVLDHSHGDLVREPRSLPDCAVCRILEIVGDDVLMLLQYELPLPVARCSDEGTPVRDQKLPACRRRGPTLLAPQAAASPARGSPLPDSGPPTPRHYIRRGIS